MAPLPGDVYVALNPLDDRRRIRVVRKPVSTPGLWGFGKVEVETLAEDGRRMRRRRLEVRQLHAVDVTAHGRPRVTGYALEMP